MAAPHGPTCLQPGRTLLTCSWMQSAGKSTRRWFQCARRLSTARLWKPYTRAPSSKPGLRQPKFNHIPTEEFMSKTMKVAVIGVGGIAKTHMPGWMQSDLAEVVAGADISQEALESFGKQHEIKRLTTDPAELINDRGIDIIDICTPNMYHEPLAVAALDAGKHVLCEKPLAPTPEAVRRMIAARDRSGK